MELDVLAWPGARRSCPRVPVRGLPSVADVDDRLGGWVRVRPFELRDGRDGRDCEVERTDGFWPQEVPRGRLEATV